MNVNIGDIVSLKLWDETERPENRMGICTVKSTDQETWCQSGIMVTVKSAWGRTQRVDSSWLSPVPEPRSAFQKAKQEMGR